MSQKTKEKTTRGRASTATQAVGISDRDQPAATTATAAVNTDMITVGSQTDNIDVMTKILERLDAIEAQNRQVLEVGIECKKEQDILKVRLDNHIEDSSKTWSECQRKLVIADHQIKVASEINRRTELQLNSIENQSKICNIRIEGKKEEEGENLMRFVLDIAKQVGASTITQADVQRVARLGKPTNNNPRLQNNKPRTIIVNFTGRQARNKLYFARSKLHQVEAYRGIFVNDDVSVVTKRQRDEYRSVAALARRQGAEIRVHDDGLIINGNKYLLGESHTLPIEYSMAKAKTVECGGELYFASHYSYLSNFAPSVIVHEGLVYPTAEHFYQAEKCLHAQDECKRKRVMSATTPLEAKRIADDIKSTPEWRNVRDIVMKTVVEEKFKQNPGLADQLLTTGDMVLNEATNNQHFGIGVTINSREINDKSYRGANMLGQIIMGIRAQIKLAAE